MDATRRRVRHVRFRSRSIPKHMLKGASSAKDITINSNKSNGNSSRRSRSKPKKTAIKRSKSSKTIRNRGRRLHKINENSNNNSDGDGSDSDNSDNDNNDEVYIIDEKKVESRTRARSSVIFTNTQIININNNIDQINNNDFSNVPTRSRPVSVQSDSSEADDWDQIKPRKRGATSGPSKKEQQAKNDRMFIVHEQESKSSTESLDASDEILFNEWKDSIKTLKQVAPTLRQRISSLHQMTAVLKSGLFNKLQPRTVARETNSASKRLALLLNDHHIDVVTAVATTIIALASRIGRTKFFDDSVKNLLVILMKLHNSSVKGVSQVAMDTCHELIDRVNPIAIIEVFVFHGVSDNHRRVRTKCIEYLSQILLNIVDLGKHRRFAKHHPKLLDRIASVVHANVKRDIAIKQAAIGLAQLLQSNFA